MFGFFIRSTRGVTKMEEIQQVLFLELLGSSISVTRLFVWKYPACQIFPDSTIHVGGYIQKFRGNVVEVFPNLFESPAEVPILQRSAPLNHHLFQLKRV